MNNINEAPVLIIVENGTVSEAILCRDGNELDDRFADEMLGRGIEPNDEDMDEGHFEFEDGTIIFAVWAFPSNEEPSGNRTL